MAHVAQALLILFFVAVLGLLRVRAGSALVRVLYTRPLVLWLATTVVVPAVLILTGGWRSVDWGGVGYFMTVAVLAFTGVVIACGGYRMMKRVLGTDR